MNILGYFKERIYYFLLNLIIFIIVLFVMKVAKVPNVVIFLMFLIWFTPVIIYSLVEYFKAKNFFGKIQDINEGLDKKYLLPEIIEEPNFMEGQIVYEALREANKSMYENVKLYKNKELEYREYIETWVTKLLQQI